MYSGAVVRVAVYLCCGVRSERLLLERSVGPITVAGSLVVRLVGLEPTRPCEPQDFKSCAYADSATAARGQTIAEFAYSRKRVLR